MRESSDDKISEDELPDDLFEVEVLDDQYYDDIGLEVTGEGWLIAGCNSGSGGCGCGGPGCGCGTK